MQRDKGSYRDARRSWETSLEIFLQLDPESAAVAGVSNNLGNLSMRVGDFERARRRYEDSLALRRRLSPDSVAVAESVNNLGSVALQQDRLDDARALFEESLELKRRVGAEPLSLANTLLNLGEVCHRQGQREAAESWYRQSLELRENVAPDAASTAEARIALGRVVAAAGRLDEGIAMWRGGLDVLDANRRGFRFSAQERSIFASRYQDHYRDLAALLADAGRTEEAFDLVERSRARALRMMTATSAAAAPREAPAKSWRQVRDALDPGQRLLLFSVGRHETLVFVGSTNGLVTAKLSVERDELERGVELFRALVARARGRHRAEIEPALRRRSAALYDRLIAPVAERIEGAERLLLVPDRPLNTLPFAALAPHGSGPGVLRELPLSYSVSGTLFAVAKSRRMRPSGPPSLAVFARGEPVDTEDVRLPPLPGVADEARRIASIFGDRAVLRTGGAASESAAKAMLAASRSSSAAGYLHFATHAVSDDRTPLESRLMLAPGGGEDGRLHAREVIELQGEGDGTDAVPGFDLVTLSACESGLGRDLGGEGVLGLSHAFLFSGARSLVTSLWPVSDRSTARWMEAFYGALARGTPRDRAVLEAQESVRESEADHPYHWAAFQLWGDWAS